MNFYVLLDEFAYSFSFFSYWVGGDYKFSGLGGGDMQEFSTMTINTRQNQIILLFQL